MQVRQYSTDIRINWSRPTATQTSAVTALLPYFTYLCQSELGLRFFILLLYIYYTCATILLNMEKVVTEHLEGSAVS